MIDGVLFAIAAVIALIAVAGVFNTLLLNTRERVRDTATLKALGMSPRQLIGMVAASAGFLALLGGRCQWCRNDAQTWTGHRSRKITPAIIAEADLIFVMTPGHLEQVKQMGGRGKVHVIDEYASGASHEGIMDPYGGDLDAYRHTADALEMELEKLFDRVKG